MRFLPGNAQHIGARHSQQDSFGFADPGDRAFLAHGGFLAIVCDGMGGMEHGDLASRTAVRVFLEAYRRKTPEESIPAALDRSVHEANFQVVTLARGMGMSEGIGTTLVAVAIHETSVYFISVGDSGIFHCSGRPVSDDQPAAHFRQHAGCGRGPRHDVAGRRAESSRARIADQLHRRRVAGGSRSQSGALSTAPRRYHSAGERRNVQNSDSGRNSSLPPWSRYIFGGDPGPTCLGQAARISGQRHGPFDDTRWRAIAGDGGRAGAHGQDRSAIAAVPPPPPPPPPLPGATPEPAMSWPAPEEFQNGTHQAGRNAALG